MGNNLKSLLLVLFCFFTSLVYSQGTQTEIWLKKSAVDSQHALLHLPDDYNTTSANKKYPVLWFFHGLGEGGNDLATIYNHPSAGGPAYEIARGHNMQFVNPITGAVEKYIVVSPQSNEPERTNKFQTPFLIADFLAKYPKADVNRMVFSAISQGAKATVEYFGGLAGDPQYKAAGVVLMSGAISGGDIQPIAYKLWNDGVNPTALWGFGGKTPAGVWDTHGANTGSLVWNYNQKMHPDQGKMTEYIYDPAHWGWHQFFNPNYRETFQGYTWSIYEWGLTKSIAQSSSPFEITGGPDQTITLPTDNTVVSVSAVAATGQSIQSYLWTKISGPGATSFGTNTQSSTTVTGLEAGLYQIRVLVTQNNGATLADTVQIAVNAAPTVVFTVNAGSDQTIQLPTSSTTVSASGNAAGGQEVTSVTWSKVSGPGTPTFATGDQPSTVINNLQQGTYVFRITAVQTDGTSKSDDLTIVVNPLPTGCAGTRKNLARFSWGLSLNGQTYTHSPGDTLVVRLQDTWEGKTLSLQNFHGTENCPIVIINEGGQVSLAAVALINCTNIKFTGSGHAGSFYGFYITPLPTANGAGTAFAVSGKSKNIEVERYEMYRETYAAWVKNEADCDQSLNYPNWRMDNISFHDIKGFNIAQDGFYFGSTSPNGMRTINCNGVNISPVPTRLSNIKIYNVILDSVGRTAIQLSGADSGLNQIYNNRVTRVGYEQNQTQGSGIILGGTTRAEVFNNYIRQTFMHGIFLLGSGFSKIYNNNIDSSGFIGQSISNTTGQPGSIFSDTRATYPANDSTKLWIYSNILGRNQLQVGEHIVLLKSFNTYNVGNKICGNTIQNGSPAIIYTAPGIDWSATGCTGGVVNNAPNANAGIDQTIQLPVNSVTLSATGSTDDYNIVSYTWSKVGSAGGTIVAPNGLSTEITGLTQGVHEYKLVVVDDSLTSSEDVVRITVLGSNIVPTVNAGVDQRITSPTNVVTLSGTSTDSDGSIVNRGWSKISGPETYSITDPNNLNTTVTNLITGTYVFRLTVVDNNGATQSDNITITVDVAATQSKVIKVLRSLNIIKVN